MMCVAMESEGTPSDSEATAMTPDLLFPEAQNPMEYSRGQGRPDVLFHTESDRQILPRKALSFCVVTDRPPELPAKAVPNYMNCYCRISSQEGIATH